MFRFSIMTRNFTYQAESNRREWYLSNRRSSRHFLYTIVKKPRRILREDDDWIVSLCELSGSNLKNHFERGTFSSGNMQRGQFEKGPRFLTLSCGRGWP